MRQQQAVFKCHLSILETDADNADILQLKICFPCIIVMLFVGAAYP